MQHKMNKKLIVIAISIAIIMTLVIESLAFNNNFFFKIFSDDGNTPFSYDIDEFQSQGYKQENGEFTTINNDSWFLKEGMNRYIHNIYLDFKEQVNQNVPISIYYTTDIENFNEEEVVRTTINKNSEEIEISLEKNIRNIRIDIGDNVNQNFKLSSISFNEKSKIVIWDAIRMVSIFILSLIVLLYMLFFRKKINLDSIILSWFSVFSLKYMIGSSINIGLSNSILSIIFFIIFNSIIKYSISISNKRMLLYSYPFGLMFSFMLIIGAELKQDYTINFNSDLFTLIVAIIGASCIFTSLLLILIYKLPSIKEKLFGVKIEKVNIIVFQNKKSRFWITWLIIFICWILNFLLSFPGIYTYDAMTQVNQLRFGNQLSSHHPVLHTIYLDIFIIGGNKVFGSYSIGMALYSLSQMFIMSGIFAYACNYIYKKNVPALIKLFAVAFFAILPLNSLYAITATKDVIFSGIFLILFLFTIDMIMDQEKFFSSLKLQIRYIIIAILMCMFRNNGIYVLIFCMPFFILFLRSKRKNVALIFTVILSLNLLYNGPLMSALNVQKGSFSEALSAPIQMLGRAIKDHSNTIPKEELDIIYEIMPEKTGELYNPMISDPIKSQFKIDVFKNDIKKYIKVWFLVGREFPESYINGFLSTNLGFWYPDKEYPGYYMDYDMWNIDGDYILLNRMSLSPTLEKFYQSVATGVLQTKVPVISMLFSPGFYFWLLLISILIFSYRRNYKLLLSLSLHIGLWGTLALSPLAIIRYVYPLVCSTPIIVTYIFENRNEKN